MVSLILLLSQTFCLSFIQLMNVTGTMKCWHPDHTDTEKWLKTIKRIAKEVKQKPYCIQECDEYNGIKGEKCSIATVSKIIKDNIRTWKQQLFFVHTYVCVCVCLDLDMLFDSYSGRNFKVLFHYIDDEFYPLMRRWHRFRVSKIRYLLSRNQDRLFARLYYCIQLIHFSHNQSNCHGKKKKKNRNLIRSIKDKPK